ncbi:hypothetical protein DITRI_Ditri08aG0063100 [Diplodiscus trichospermus]
MIFPQALEWASTADFSVLSWKCFFKLAEEHGCLEVCLYACWLIWDNRNKVFHEGICKRPTALVRLANVLCADFIQAQDSGTVSRQRQRVSWSLPSGQVVKINVDGSFNGSTRTAQLGLVPRNAKGDILFAAVRKRAQVGSPLRAEFMAIIFGLEKAKMFNIDLVVIESDCLTAIKEIQSVDISTSIWFGLILDAVQRGKQFSFSEFTFAHREANRLPPELAKWPVISFHDVVWRGELPYGLCNPDVVSS